ncbi:MAG: NTP transferase domain-containing protein [Candidatus Aceula meridiana]|nr:NTP transferase domain-containing protein [Candidatus Aceula meridiana]
MAELKAIILAAGKGTRMKSDVPKVLHEVCGKSLIDYVLDAVIAIKAKAFVVLGHKADKVAEHLGSKAVCVYQKRLLGTADAIKSAQKFFYKYAGDVLIVCGDTPLLAKETLQKIVRKHRKTKAACTVLTAKINNPLGYGRIVRSALGSPIAIREEKDASVSEKKICEINVGVYVFKSKELFSFVNKIKVNPVKREYYLTDIVELLAKVGKKVEAVTTENAFEGLGINSREQLAQAGAILRENILKKLMRQGVTIVDPKTAYIDSKVKIGRDTTIQPCVVIEKDVVIGKGCTIGPFCHIRPGTRLKDGVQIGNFAEVSRTHIGQKSLMKHFGFLGDARVGKKVNIGAGTVTANYDGKNKNITHIGDEAFVGSDTILIAPATIGKKAKTGAGCVVTRGKRVPSGKLIVGVPGKIKTKGKKT